LPDEVLNSIRETLCKSIGIQIKGTSKVSLFLYDNNTLIVESFNDDPVEIELLFIDNIEAIKDLMTGETIGAKTIAEFKLRNGRVISPEKKVFKITIPPHSFRAFKID
jgi:hypothetical protein